MITTPAPGLEPSTPQRWLLSLGMAVALLQGAIFALVDPDLAGWHPHHGHMTIAGHVAAHTHPWDADHGRSPGLVDPEHAHEGPTTIFSGMADGLAGSVTALVLAAVTLSLAVALADRAVARTVERRMSGFAGTVPTPPPRG